MKLILEIELSYMNTNHPDFIGFDRLVLVIMLLLLLLFCVVFMLFCCVVVMFVVFCCCFHVVAAAIYSCDTILPDRYKQTHMHSPHLKPTPALCCVGHPKVRTRRGQPRPWGTRSSARAGWGSMCPSSREVPGSTGSCSLQKVSHGTKMMRYSMSHCAYV